MNRFTHSAIALATLTLAGVFSFAPKASADDAIIRIDTTVTASCTFGTQTAIGVLGQNFNTNTLDSAGTGGTTATIPLTCNNPGSQLAITNVTFDEPSGASSFLESQLVTVSHTNGSITYDGNSYGTPVNITESPSPQTVSINAKAVYSSPLKAGNYAFIINLTATP